jgi:hypothetical protein
MIDSDDADMVGLIGLLMPEVLGFLILAIGIAVAIIASQNEQECGERHCDHGTPKLIKHECLCVEGAKP